MENKKGLDDIINAAFKELETLSIETILSDLKDCSEGGLRDVLDTKNSQYYQWLAALMRTYKPRQIVELGGAMGVSALCMLSQLPVDAKLYSITLEEESKEFSFIKTEYPQLTKIIGDDSDLSLWPKDLDWSKTDLLFIDGEHTSEAVRRELKDYLPKVGKDTLVLLDDIKMPEIWPVWLEIENDKIDISVLHHSGFGCLVT